MKQKFEKEEERNKRIMTKFVEQVLFAIEGDETDETEKTFLKKVKLFFSSVAKKKEDISRLKKFNHAIKRSESKNGKQVKANKADGNADLTNEPQKSKLEKFKSFFSCCTKEKNEADERADLTHEPEKTGLEKFKSFLFCTRKKNKDGPKQKQFKDFIKRSKKVKSLRNYIKQKWKWIVLFLVNYILTLGEIVSMPILVNRFGGASQNQTEKERFITENSL